MMTDENADIVMQAAYSAYGEILVQTDKDSSNYLFTGQEYDGGTELYYYGARYYDPMLCRFTQADTILDGLNRYAYCGNNPVNYVDPSGHIWYDAGGVRDSSDHGFARSVECMAAAEGYDHVIFNEPLSFEGITLWCHSGLRFSDEPGDSNEDPIISGSKNKGTNVSDPNVGDLSSSISGKINGSNAINRYSKNDIFLWFIEDTVNIPYDYHGKCFLQTVFPRNCKYFSPLQVRNFSVAFSCLLRCNFEWISSVVH